MVDQQICPECRRDVYVRDGKLVAHTYQGVKIQCPGSNTPAKV